MGVLSSDDKRPTLSDMSDLNHIHHTPKSEVNSNGDEVVKKGLGWQKCE